MPNKTRTVRPGNAPNTVRAEDGTVLQIPMEWSLLPPGDATHTRRVKSAGPSWTIEEKVGRRNFSRGVLANAAIIEDVRRALILERATPAYAKQRVKAIARRNEEQQQYTVDFESEVYRFLAFAPLFEAQARALAQAVTAHATPVGSGTVARTERIPVNERARAAVIAWMRHQTTAYDNMQVARIKGARRELRRELAQISNELLNHHRRNLAHPVALCPLCRSLQVHAGNG